MWGDIEEHEEFDIVIATPQSYPKIKYISYRFVTTHCVQ